MGDVIAFWSMLFGATVLITYLVHKKASEKRAARKLENDRKRQADEQRRREQEARKASQLAIQGRLKTIVSNSRHMASELSSLVNSAERSLSRAEFEFIDGAFAPFWDAVEQCANHLATFDSHIRILESNARNYKDVAQQFESEPPFFELGISVFPDATRTVERMQAVVRRAQKHFQFATIYEQRKTNQLLVTGFRNLGDALAGLQDRLESSIEQFASSLTSAITERWALPISPKGEHTWSLAFSGLASR